MELVQNLKKFCELELERKQQQANIREETLELKKNRNKCFNNICQQTLLMFEDRSEPSWCVKVSSNQFLVRKRASRVAMVRSDLLETALTESLAQSQNLDDMVRLTLEKLKQLRTTVTYNISAVNHVPKNMQVDGEANTRLEEMVAAWVTTKSRISQQNRTHREYEKTLITEKNRLLQDEDLKGFLMNLDAKGQAVKVGQQKMYLRHKKSVRRKPLREPEICSVVEAVLRMENRPEDVNELTELIMHNLYEVSEKTESDCFMISFPKSR